MPTDKEMFLAHLATLEDGRRRGKAVHLEDLLIPTRRQQLVTRTARPTTDDFVIKDEDEDEDVASAGPVGKNGKSIEIPDATINSGFTFQEQGDPGGPDEDSSNFDGNGRRPRRKLATRLPRRGDTPELAEFEDGGGLSEVDI